MLEQIRSCDPDIIFLLETNTAWENGMSELETNYPFRLKAPLENTYGLLFYSRFPLKEKKISYLVKNDIPSIETIIQLQSGKELKIWGLHPEPPVPGENLYSTAKDKELMKVALSVRECTMPVLVFGDLNDVAWSHTTELFRKTSNLLDPRRGRGFYSTFSAHHWLIRFPLDYIFCSEHFGLINMRRMPPNGSDHFATFTHLALLPELLNEQNAPEADRQELKEANEMAKQSVNPVE
jgi:endonuclease/exonuclease/phosphatase (EEP) superfamily protein YafD